MAPPTMARADGATSLTPDMQKYIQRALLDELADQTRALTEYTSALDDLADDLDVDLETRSETAAARERAVAAITDIYVALARLEGGTYGTCDSCGQAIPVARLEALPTTRRCVTCAAAPTA